MDPLPAQIGKYRVTGAVGRGGMAVILSAHDPDLERDVAIKLIRTTLLSTPDSRSRFVREARTLARLSDPHVVQVFDFQPEGDQPYLVMELVKGRTLRQILTVQGAQSLSRVIDCAWQVLRGLDAAHSAGVIHRDLKPGNVMLDERGVYKLVDFGLAEALDDEDLTAVGQVVGTLRYLSPERINGHPPTAAGDLWALGITLWELASAQRYEGGEICLPKAPTALATWFASLIAPNVAQRFASAGDALAALAQAMPEPEPAMTLTTAITAQHRARSDETVLLADHHSRHGSNSGTSGTSGTSETSSPSNSGGSSITRTTRPVQRAPPSQPCFSHPRIPFVVKLITAIWVISSTATFFVGWTISERALDEQFQMMRQELQGIAADAALLIDPAAHARLAANPESADHDFSTMQAALSSLRANHPEVRNVYSLAKLPETASTGIVQFICDASDESDRDHNGVIGADEERAEPGQRYPAQELPQLLRGFTEITTDDEINVDDWGTWLSGYAPIRLADGTSVGLIGVDLPANRIDDLRRAFLWRTVSLLAVTLVAFLAAGVLVAFRLRKPVAELQRGMLAVAAGDLEVTINVRSHDEFQLLAEVFAHMRDELQRAAAVRVAFEGFVTRTLSERTGMHQPTEAAGARLYCHFAQPQHGASQLPPRLAVAMPRLFALAQQQGGFPERVAAGGVLISFPATSVHDVPQERAARAALALLAELEHNSGILDLAFGLAAGPLAADATAIAIELGQAGALLGIDLVVNSATFAGIRPGFYADRITLTDLPGDFFAIKGAVSG